MGHELRRGRAVTDNTDALACEVDLVVPARRVHHLALEVVHALDVGVARLLQDTGAGDDDLGVDDALGARLLVLDGDVVELRGGVPVDADDAGVEAAAAPEVVLGREVAPVDVDVGLRGVVGRPVGFEVGGEGVQVHFDVGARAGVGVVPPCPSYIICLFDDLEVALSVLLNW